MPGKFWYVPFGLCIARQTTAYLHTPASSAFTACCTAPPMLADSTWMCQLRFGSFSIAIMQFTETMVTPSISAWPVAGSSGYVASPSMSAMASPESSTAPLTASSACAARGISAERVAFENPTPLTAILQRFSHMRHSLRASRNCGSVISSFSGWNTTSTRRPTFASVYSALQQVARHQRAGRVVELDDDARVRHGRRRIAYRPRDT